MKPENVTRYVRPEDVPLLDDAILEPLVTRVAKDMAASYSDRSVEEWLDLVQQSLLSGELAIVIDDHNKRLGLVATDRPPFSSIVKGGEAGSGVKAADPLGLRDLSFPPQSPDQIH